VHVPDAHPSNDVPLLQPYLVTALTINGVTDTLAIYNGAVVISDEGRQILSILLGANAKESDLGRLNEVRHLALPRLPPFHPFTPPPCTRMHPTRVLCLHALNAIRLHARECTLRVCSARMRSTPSHALSVPCDPARVCPQPTAVR
jgi:hypothetical protein